MNLNIGPLAGICLMLGSCCHGVLMGADEKTDAPQAAAEAVTYNDLLKNGIVKYLDKEIRLTTAFAWEYASVKIPEDPTPMDAVQKQAGVLKALFHGEGFEKVRSSARHFRVTGDGVKKVPDEKGLETYVAGNLALANGAKNYIVTGQIVLRSSFKPEMLKNPAFVKQCDNPAYWSQTFELKVDQVAEPSDKMHD